MTVETRAPEAAAGPPVDRSLTEQLAALVCATRAADIPDAVRANAAWWVLDWLGCAIAGLDTPPGRILTEHTREQPAGAVSCLGLSEGRAPQVAALHNGGVSHV